MARCTSRTVIWFRLRLPATRSLHAARELVLLKRELHGVDQTDDRAAVESNAFGRSEGEELSGCLGGNDFIRLEFAVRVGLAWTVARGEE